MSCAPQHQANATPTRRKGVRQPDYIFELKHDGFRAIAYIADGEWKLVSHNQNLFNLFESLKNSLAKYSRSELR
jgi:ATP-dependent DNA ligase